MKAYGTEPEMRDSYCGTVSAAAGRKISENIGKKTGFTVEKIL